MHLLRLLKIYIPIYLKNYLKNKITSVSCIVLQILLSGISCLDTSIGYLWNNRHINVVIKDKRCFYLVFKLSNWFSGLESTKSSISFVNYESEIDIKNRVINVHLVRLQGSGYIPKVREDGWIEVKLGYLIARKSLTVLLKQDWLRWNVFTKVD